jgi:hypothetical protein
MRTPPPVNLPEGGTPAERLDMAFRKVLTVSKAELLGEEATERRARKKLLERDPSAPSLGKRVRGLGPKLFGPHVGFRKPGR